MEPDDFKIVLSVRDYECDIQGVVNNSVYQNYLEHARHQYLKTIGVNFKEFTDAGINLTVTRAELDYKFPLTSGDDFAVTVSMKKESKIRFAFYQNVIRLPDEKVILKGKIIGVAMNAQGKPFIPSEINDVLVSQE